MLGCFPTSTSGTQRLRNELRSPSLRLIEINFHFDSLNIFLTFLFAVRAYCGPIRRCNHDLTN